MTIYQKILKKLSNDSALFIQFISHANVQILNNVVPFEKKLSKAFKFFGLPVERLSLVDNLFSQILGNVDNTAIGIKVLEDSTMLFKVVRSLGGKGRIVGNKAAIIFDEVTEKEIFKNYSIGLARKTLDFRVFLRYAHNVHTVSLIVKNVESLLANTLEKLPNISMVRLRLVIEDMEIFDEVGSIPDVTVYMQSIRWYYEKSDVRKYIFDANDIPEIPITFDSKFVTSSGSLSKDSLIKQQLKQAKGKRSNIIEKALDYTLANDGNTHEEAVSLVSRFFPDMFQHYVVVPKNYPVSDSVNLKFAQKAREVFKEEYHSLLLSKGISEGSPAYNLFFSKMDEFIDDFYTEGRFILFSEMDMPL